MRRCVRPSLQRRAPPPDPFAPRPPLQAAGKTNVAFMCLFLRAKVEQCLDLLCRTGRVPEAAFFARTYAPSHMSRIVQLWRAELAKKNEKTAMAIADPEEYPNLFDQLDMSMKMEQWLAEHWPKDRPAAAFTPDGPKSVDDFITLFKSGEPVAVPAPPEQAAEQAAPSVPVEATAPVETAPEAGADPAVGAAADTATGDEVDGAPELTGDDLDAELAAATDGQVRAPRPQPCARPGNAHTSPPVAATARSWRSLPMRPTLQPLRQSWTKSWKANCSPRVCLDGGCESPKKGRWPAQAPERAQGRPNPRVSAPGACTGPRVRTIKCTASIMHAFLVQCAFHGHSRAPERPRASLGSSRIWSLGTRSPSSPPRGQDHPEFARPPHVYVLYELSYGPLIRGVLHVDGEGGARPEWRARGRLHVLAPFTCFQTSCS